jgi:hypothetical protein
MAQAVNVTTEIVWDIIPEFTAKMNMGADAIKRRALERIAMEARARVRVKTGATKDSIQVTGDTVEAGEAALFLEYGTRNMPAYPFLGPAAATVQKSFAAEFAGLFTVGGL